MSADAPCLFCDPDPTVNRIVARMGRWYARRDNFPATEGHVEIVPFRHEPSLWAFTADEMAEAFQLLAAVKDHLATAYHPDGYTIGINEGAAAGRSVDHLHIHLIPRYWGDVPDPRGGIRQVVPNCDPDLWASTLSFQKGGSDDR